jgi:hypothetical protein
VAVRIASAEIKTLREETLRRIVVSIQDEGGKMQLVGALGDIVAAAGAGEDKRGYNAQNDT